MSENKQLLEDQDVDLETKRIANIEYLKKEILPGKILLVSVSEGTGHGDQSKLNVHFIRSDAMTASMQFDCDTYRLSEGIIDAERLVTAATLQAPSLTFKPINWPLSRGFQPDAIIDMEQGRWRYLGMGWAAADIALIDDPTCQN